MTRREDKPVAESTRGIRFWVVVVDETDPAVFAPPAFLAVAVMTGFCVTVATVPRVVLIGS